MPVRLTLAVTLTLWLAPVRAPAASQERYTLSQILRAIRLVESGDRDNGPTGDGGKAVGPYQIHREYWIDGGGKPEAYPEAARTTRGSTPVVVAYLQRYEPGAYQRRDWRRLATLHHCGPSMKHHSNAAYLIKIQKALQSTEVSNESRR